MTHNTNNNQPRNLSAMYEQMYQLYTNVAQQDAQNQILQLPQDIQNEIYGQVFELANRPQTDDAWWGGRNAFQNLQRLQKAIQNVAYSHFRNMPIEQKNPVAERIWINGGRQEGDPNWGENHANDNADILFRSLIAGTRVNTPPTTVLNPPNILPPQQNLPRNIIQPGNGFSHNDYISDDLLADIISNLGVEERSVPSVSSTTTTTVTSTTSTTPIQTTSNTTRTNSRFDWGSRNTTVLAGMGNNVNSSPLFGMNNNNNSAPVFDFSNRGALLTPPINNNTNNRPNDLNPVQEHLNPGQLRDVLSRIQRSSTSPSTSTIETPQQVVREEPAFTNDAVSDEDFERLMRMWSQEETRTTPNTSTIDNSSNIELVEEDPMTEKKRMAIERLCIIASFGENAVDNFEFINTVSAFQLDEILLPYDRNILVDRLVDLARWAEIGQAKMQTLTVDPVGLGCECVINAYRQGGPSSTQYTAARAQISQLISYFEQKRRESGVNEQQLKVQCRGIIDKILDANQNCVDQMNSQLQDMLLDIAVDAYVPDGDRRLGKMQCRAGQEITSHKVNILRQIILRQNPNEQHMADLEREILRSAAPSLGLCGAAFTTGAHFAYVVRNLQQRTEDALNDYYQQDYRPLAFLATEIALAAQQRRGTGEAGPIGKLRNELVEWAGEQFALLDEDADDATETDMVESLSKNYVAGSFTDNFEYGGRWSDAGTLFILEAAGIIQQKQFSGR